MKDDAYIIVTARGIERMCKTPNFTLEPGEKAFRLRVEIPPEVFAPASIPTVTLAIGADLLRTEVVAEGEIRPTPETNGGGS